MRFAATVLAAAMVATPAPAQLTAEAAMKATNALTTTRCAKGTESSEEILVCADRVERYRLPLPVEHEADRAVLPGEIARASADPIASGGCGIFRGQRRCGKAEARQYGLGGGRDPLSFASRLITRLVDPQAETGTPDPLPESVAAPPR